MIVGIHQPNYFPWLGYFLKLKLCDSFIFHDAVSLSKVSYSKRTSILENKHGTSIRWLRVPLKKHSHETKAFNIEIDHGQNWQKDHLNCLTNAYASTLHFGEIMPTITDWLIRSREVQRLADYNIDIIEKICGKIELSPHFKRSSNMEVVGRGTELNIALVRAMDGDTYVSGSGSNNYEDTNAFENSEIRLVNISFDKWIVDHPYKQGQVNFVNGLSVLDALMHIGWEGVTQVLNKFAETYTSKMRQ